jgi:putative two-component system response regulator
MPGMDGFDLLRSLHPVTDDQWLPVIVVTGDRAVETRRRALEEGAHDFITKPFDRAEAMLRVRNVLHARFLHRRLARANRSLVAAVEERTTEPGEARLEILERLAAAGEFRDDDTGAHADRVGVRAAQLARAVRRPRDEVELIRHAAPLHDIGKLGIPDSIVLKPGALTPEERREMERHTTIGAELLSGSGSPLLQMAEQIALTHHERWDGSGYPNGLAGEAIPLAGRIVAVADVFDSLTQDRPYRDAWSLDRAIAEIESQRGRHFDPDVVEAFAQTISTLALPAEGGSRGEPAWN